MKRGIWGRALLAAAALCLGASVSSAASMGKDPLVGNWDLDATTSAGFKSGHVSVATTKDKDARHVTVDLAPANGATIHYETTFKYDGEVVPVAGNTYFDSADTVRVDRNTSIRTERRGGKVVGVTTIEVAKDGKSFSGSSKATSPDGKQFTRALTWRRAKK
jgi:hypothetical protein